MSRPEFARAARATTLLLAALLAAPLPAAGQATDKPDSDKPWKVEEPHGPVKTVSFTTDEGTWISLDVSPDGGRIAFSLLGDLYLMPIAGGEARRITEGAAYDVQPRFSPDGKWIAFASDRGGIENLWLCDLDGKNARQVSQEKDHTVNTPSWSPDGDYLVGRKRFTDRSSLGTVELWMWHLKGGQGFRLTDRDKQPDAADAAFSRDGRFIYFGARDARYQYDRNVDQGIWQIKRFDRVTGQLIPLTGEFGGSAAPTVSPDGKSLAFVRRVRSKTQLETMDLSSGRTRMVAEGLQRDNQEGFAFHGVFPGYAWTPDGKAVVATAENKIWRWDVTTGQRTAIPFTAKVDQRVAEAVRFRRKLGDAQFRARVLRWPVQSPDGKWLVFSAVGHLYCMQLPGGTPRRLTSVADLEYAPAFSPDGKRIAFVSWNDEEGGHVWTASFGADGTAGAPRRVTQDPGQYANPSFSPDGRRIVFVRGSGATFRGDDLGNELWQEIHWIDAGGGPSNYVIGAANRGANRRMTRPTFSPDGERIFYVDDEPPAKPIEVPKTALASVKLDGTDKQVRLRWAKAEEARVSPDGKWVAYSELHNAYVVPLPSAGKDPVEVAAENGALPVAQLTDEGGEWVDWADGGRAVTWVYGPTFRRIALDAAYPTPPPPDAAPPPDEKAKKPAKKELPKSESFEVALMLERARPSGVVAYTNARLVTMKGDEVIEKGTIVVENDRIKEVGSSKQIRVPAGAKVVDLTGKTVVPGLFDAHAHLHYSTLDVFPQRPWKYLANLAYGITTTHDPSASTQEVFGQGEMVEAGAMVGPRIFSTGYILYGADDPSRALVNSLDDARRHVRRLKSLGALSVKSYMQPRREQRQWIIQAAREEGLMVVPEGGGDLEMDMTMILDGHTTIEHALPFAPLAKDVVTLFGQSGTAYTPTLLVAYGGPQGENWFYQHYDVWRDERLLRHVPQGTIDPRARVRSMIPDDMWHHLGVAASARKVVDAGGRVLLGGHGQLQGLGPHWEMWAYVQAGMTPIQAIRVATLHPAEALGLDADLGSIEAGKLADFVVLDRNPVEKIENTDSVSVVVKNGVSYTPDDLALKSSFLRRGGNFRSAEPFEGP
jgi:Tol biopolymer transport system component/imidazolonepropionase-like amidohydrolase